MPPMTKRFEHELGRDAHEQVPIERMATCGEWPCLGTTVDVVEDRCLDLDKTTRPEE